MMIAEVPFAFQAGRERLESGKYVIEPVTHTKAINAYRFMNVDTRDSIFVSGSYPLGGGMGLTTEPARLVFRCTGSDCNLSEVWTGSNVGQKIREPRRSETEDVRVAAIPIKRSSR
jgi:hypothetical protein